MHTNVHGTSALLHQSLGHLMLQSAAAGHCYCGNTKPYRHLKVIVTIFCTSMDFLLQSSRRVASETLFMLLKFASLIGCIILVFGYSYSYLLLQLYGGERLTDGAGLSLNQCLVQ